MLNLFNWQLISAILIPNVGGWISTFTMIGQVKSPAGKAWYQQLIKPVWTPPNWLFGPAWTFLYCMMGYASYMVLVDCEGFTSESTLPLTLYAVQLVLNWLWTPIFFGLHKVGLALIHMIFLDLAAIACTASFNTINKGASYLMIPYLTWLTFATCLNYAIWNLNKNVNVE